MPKPALVGPFIRDYLLEHGPSSAYEIWKAWAETRERAGLEPPSYYSFYQNYIWRLKQMGLIREVGRVKGKGRFDKVLLDVVEGRIDDPAWYSVQNAYAERRGYGRGKGRG